VTRPPEGDGSLSSECLVLGAMDKFRGTATSRSLSEAVARASTNSKCSAASQPLSDGGEGFRDAFDGEVHSVEVSGPLGETVEARITMTISPTGVVGVVEVADVVGRDLLKSPTREEALEASSQGVAYLILQAARLGAESVLIGCGGSATSDGGRGCYQILRDAGGLPVPVVAATDVSARFSGVLRYATQKGVADDDLQIVESRLKDVRGLYLREQGVDVERIDRTGASGGIPGAIAALGGTLTSGFDAVSQAVNLPESILRSSLVVTGEGRFDEGSLEGKVTIGVANLVRGLVPLLVICGSVDARVAQIVSHDFENVKIISLSDRFGAEASMNSVCQSLETVVEEEIESLIGQ